MFLLGGLINVKFSKGVFNMKLIEEMILVFGFKKDFGWNKHYYKHKNN